MKRIRNRGPGTIKVFKGKTLSEVCVLKANESIEADDHAFIKFPSAQDVTIKVTRIEPKDDSP